MLDRYDSFKEARMIRMLRFIIILAILVGGIGYYRGWFSAHSNGQSTINVTVDRDKIDQDKTSAQQKIQQLANK